MKPAANHKLLFVFFAASGTMFLWLAGFEAYKSWLMRHDKATVQATITTARIHPCTGRGCSGVNHPYQVQYYFSPPGSDKTFSYTGQWLLYEMWVRVPESAYLTAKTSHMIDVTYAASNPRINQPSVNPTNSAYDWMGFGAFAILSFGVGWLLRDLTLRSSGTAQKRAAP